MSLLSRGHLLWRGLEIFSENELTSDFDPVKKRFVPTGTLLRVVAPVLFVLLTGCGSIVQSIEEKSPPVHGSEMAGIVYWLPKGSIFIDGTWDDKAPEPTLNVVPLIEADTSSRWRIKRKTNHLFEDTVVLGTDPRTGLLNTVNGTSEDKTAEIASTALAAAANAVAFGAVGTAPPSVVRAVSEQPCPPVALKTPFRFRIDTGDLPSGAGAFFCKTLHVVQGTKEKIFTLQISREDSPGTSHTRTLNGTVDGIVVRAPVPYLVRMQTTRDNLSMTGEQVVFLPDPDRMYWLPLDRSPFVKNETKIALVNGVVQNVTITRQSLILGIVGIPKTILSALIPLK